MPPARASRSVALARARRRRTALARCAAGALGALALLPLLAQAAALLQHEGAAFRLAPGPLVECAPLGPCVRVVSSAEVALWLTLLAGGGLVVAGAATGRGRLLRAAVWAAPAAFLLVALTQAANVLATRGALPATFLPDLAGALLVIGGVATGVGWLAWRVDPFARP